MFSDCSGLTSLNLSNFDTSIVTDMRFMFQGCTSLKSLDLSNFDTSKVVNNFQGFFGSSGRYFNGLNVYIGPNFRFSPMDDTLDLFDEESGHTNDITFHVPDEDTRNHISEVNDLVYTDGTNTYTYNFKIEGGEAGADPYIKPIYGQLYKLPDTDACYRLIQTPNIVVNAQVQCVDQQFINTKLKELTDVRFDVVENHVYDWDSMHFFTKLCIIYNDEVCIYNMLSGTYEGNVPEWVSLNETTNRSSALAMYQGEHAMQTYILQVSDILKLEVALYENPQILSGVKIIQVPEKTTGLLIRRYSSDSSMVHDLYDNTLCKFLPANDNHKVTEIFYTNNGMKNTREIVVV
jgi:surface protein